MSRGPTYNSQKIWQSEKKCIENVKKRGRLELQSRNLKQFPKLNCHDIAEDLKIADLSRNKLTELPQECTEYYSMERLILYHNMIRSIPDSVSCLHSLQFIDLSRNQLSYLPDTLCQLPSLEVLIVNNNRLVSLPEEIGKMQFLSELDASCNEITHLPVQIGDMTHLRSLNLRRNHLQEVPVEISFLRLIHMDLSANRITTLPVELRFMNSVVDLSLGENPLSCPPANLCSRGKVHVFKYLEIQAIKEDRKRGVLTDSEYRRSYRHKTSAGQLNDFRFANGFGADARRKRHTADSGYGSEQPLDRRWSQDFSQEDNKVIDEALNVKASGQALLMKSTDDQLVEGKLQQSSEEIISRAHSIGSENLDAFDETERDDRRIVASKLLERQGIPQPFHTNGLKHPVGKSSQNNSPSTFKYVDSCISSQRQVVSRRDGDKSTTADSHIAQLKMHIESRLRISLPENLSMALADGVILCHVANHVRPRAVPSIHVPSPAVPKLNMAKCRRNVENFLIACKRIGVREDLICSPADVLEPRKQGTVRVAITVSELLRFYQSRTVPSTLSGMATHIASGHHLTISSGVHL